MSEFLKYVLWELQGSLALVLLVGIAAAGVLTVAYFIHKKKYKGERKFPWGKVFLWLVFIGYMVVVMCATVLRRLDGYREWNLHLFRAWREAWNNFSVKNWANVLLNIAMFMPLGFLLPLLGKKFRKWYLTIPAGFGMSLAIELLQLAIGRGICDVDDLFANTLGAVIGFFLIMTVLALFREKGRRLKPFLIYGVLTLAPVLAISSIFAAYQVKEFGNLPMAAAYTNNTHGVEWTLDCALPDGLDKVAVYRAQTMSRDDCDALAEKFASITGQEVDLVSYYQEMAYYNLTRANFAVYYYDGSYEFNDSDHNTTDWPAADREAVEKALKAYSISVPESAVFAAEEDGWYSFTCDRHIDGNLMMDGTLRCRCGGDGTVRRMKNHLIQYTYYKEVDILSPQEAYDRMKAGTFYDNGFFEYRAPTDVSVLSCTLGYEIDTKGFYQPVYYFEVESADGRYADRIMIPAMG